jgi:prepilin-type N-terminal cleavage/methylation domain-containing protein
MRAQHQSGFSILELLAAIVAMGLVVGIATSVYSKATAADREVQAARLIHGAAHAIRASHPYKLYDQVDTKTVANAPGFEGAPWDWSYNGIRLEDVGVMTVHPVLSGAWPASYSANTAFEIRVVLGRKPSLCSTLTSAFATTARRVYVVARGQPFLLADSAEGKVLPGGMEYVGNICRGGGVELWLTFA